MSEKYPRAWGVYLIDLVNEGMSRWQEIFNHPGSAFEYREENETADESLDVVQLMSLPEHQAIVAAAVAAAVERCAGIADAVEAETMPVNRSFRDHFDNAYMVVTREACCALHTWYLSQLSGQTSQDQCGVDQNDQRRHLATERLLQECRRMWGNP